jgi:hypothetical protein
MMQIKSTTLCVGLYLIISAWVLLAAEHYASFDAFDPLINTKKSSF